MSDDLIRRSDAIEAIWGDDINPSEDGMVFEAQSHIDRDIRLIPSADRLQGWIPCSERLPNYREAVLISTFWGVRMAERDAVKEDGTDDFWYLFLNDATAHPRYVYAWMPLPEPWKGADDE